MNNIFHCTLISLSIAAGSTALAEPATNIDTDEARPHELPEYTVIESLPKATHHPIPAVNSLLVGTSLRLKFTVNERGRPLSVRLERPLTDYSDLDEMSFASEMRELVARWRFEPARDANGDAVAVNVIMPVQVVNKSGKTGAVASLVLDTEDRS